MKSENRVASRCFLHSLKELVAHHDEGFINRAITRSTITWNSSSCGHSDTNSMQCTNTQTGRLGCVDGTTPCFMGTVQNTSIGEETHTIRTTCLGTLFSAPDIIANSLETTTACTLALTTAVNPQRRQQKESIVGKWGK